MASSDTGRFNRADIKYDRKLASEARAVLTAQLKKHTTSVHSTNKIRQKGHIFNLI